MPGAKFKTEAERTAAAEKQFKDVEASYGGTDAADVASLYLARIAADKGDVASARTRLQKFISDHPKHVLVAGARYSLYRLRIDGGEAPQVAQELQAEIAQVRSVAAGRLAAGASRARLGRAGQQPRSRRRRIAAS